MRRFVPIVLALGAIALAEPAGAADIYNGSKLYAHHCRSCHGHNGKPVLPGTPDFTRGEGLLAPDQLLLRSIRFGKGLMPGFEAVLRSKEQLDVLVYVRSLHR
jgi:mono/diheme cytochrome c family protein